MYSKVIPLYIHMYLFSFRIFTHTDYYRMLREMALSKLRLQFNKRGGAQAILSRNFC